MPDHYCFVCASNEGVFLDITLDNRSTFDDQIETCFCTKNNESIDLSDKICYKCAYELDQCTKFVQKYKKSREVPEPNVQESMPCCFLCHELVESDRIFDITKDNSVFNPLRKIRSIFNIIQKNGDFKLICLTCRYNLDVLYDLKRIYQETIINLKDLINEQISYTNFPKVHTDVVNRKTTISTFPDIAFYGSVNSDSDTNEENMARGKRRGHARGRRGRGGAQVKLQSNKLKVRNCDKCHIAVANDIDMYRLHHTGLTVCRSCWLTTDPSGSKPQRRSRQIQSNLAEMKLCAVFLTDVLSQESYKKDKDKDEISEIEKDKTSEIKKNKTREMEKDKTHKMEKDETHKMKKDETHKMKKDETHKMKKDEAHKMKKDETHKMKKDDTHEMEKDKTHEVEKDKTHEMEKDKTLEMEKDQTHEMEKDETQDDSTLYSSSQEEAKSSESSSLSISPKRNHIVNGKTKQGRKRKINMESSKSDIERTPLKVTRFSKECASTNEMKSTKASGDEKQQSSSLDKECTDTNEIKSTKASVDTEQQSSSRLTRGRKRIIVDRSSDSDSSQKQKTDRIKLSDRVNKTNRKKQKTNLKETASSVYVDSSDEASNEENVKDMKSKPKSATTSAASVKENAKNTRSRTRSSSISSTEMTSMEFKSPKSSAQSEVKLEYTCDKCDKKFDTKLSIAKHRLTHLKQAALKLKKLTVPSVKENQETEADSQDEKISEKATSRPSRTTSADKHTDDPSEEIAINVEDDTDEEIFSLVNKESVKQKIEKEINDEGGDVIDKEKSESCIEEEPANEENIKITETEKCKSSANDMDDIIETENEKNRQDKDIKNEHTTKGKDTTATNEDNDKSEDKDAQKTTVARLEDHKNEKNETKEKDKDVEMKNDTEVSPTEKEDKTINECNNDKGDLHETTSDNEMIGSPVLPTRNRTKNRSESSENNLVNNCTDDKDEMTEEPEIQCDLIDVSSKKDTSESEEKIQQILPTDETETLSDKHDLDDIMIVNEDKIEELEERQNRFDEDNTEVEMIEDIDEHSSVKDIIVPDILISEKHDEVIDEDDVAIVSVDSSIEITHEKVMEETVLIDDSKNKRKLEEELKELEDLVESNVMNDKYEVQENSTYVPDNSSADAANEILKEVFDLAAAEVQQREDCTNTKNLDEVEIETLENISREIRKSADMPSLDPISVMDIDDDNGILLN